MKTIVTKPHTRLLSKIYLTGVLTFFFIFSWNIFAGEDVKKNKSSPEVTFKIIGSEPQPGLYKTCRRMLVGPWVHQPEEYQGYNGFVAWPGVTRLKAGRWLLTFSSGYWHGSPPLTEEILKDPECRKLFDKWKKIGMPFINAPRGGRAHIMHSDDQGQTWSDPKTLIDTELDDRHPTILELDDGTLLCTIFTYRFQGVAQVRYILSQDQGQTWSDPIELPGNAASFGNGSAILLSDGTIVLVAELDSPKREIGIYRSSDRGKTFKSASIVKTDHELFEPTVAELKDGRLVMITRRNSDICWSDDGGLTWTDPVSIGVDLFDPHLLLMPNGVLACFHGSYKGGALRVILSPDNGRTWHGPGEGIGYAIDPSVYGYSHPMLLPNGTVYLVYIHTGGHKPADARTQALWALRIRINDNADGIEILPAPGGEELLR
ncbi:MAG: sialidase family protein [Bacteroidota bacterium]|nr:sialidase family protein [Bacteroidota bacterium]